MSEPSPPNAVERIDLARADDPRDVVHRTVASLAQGEQVGLATTALFGVAASALNASATIAVNDALSHSGSPEPLTLLLSSPDELADWIPTLSEVGVRLAGRVWPGPVTLLFTLPEGPSLLQRLPASVSRLFADTGKIAFQVPADPFVRDVLRLLPGPIVLGSFSRCETAERNRDQLATQGVKLIIEAGVRNSAARSAVVKIDGDKWVVEIEGSLNESMLTRLAGTIILFVCTGNTCRSPMAEALCKVLIAKRLGCAPSELETHGYVVLSAGIAAMSGMAAAANAKDVVRGRGGSLDDHVSRKLTLELVSQADLILTMTHDHLDALLEHAPEAASKARLLHPLGEDVPDPVGADRETYQRSAMAIESYIVRLLESIGI